MTQTTNTPDGRDRLIEAATELFSEKGHAAVGIREIAAKAGCSLSLIKHHFGSKEGLLEHVITADLSAVGAELATAVSTDRDPRDQIEQLVELMVDVFDRHRAGLQIVLRELTQQNSPLTERLIPMIRQVIAQVVQMLEGLREQNRLREIDPELAAMLLFAMLQYYSATHPGSAELLAEPPSVTSLKRTITTVFLDGVLKDAPEPKV